MVDILSMVDLTSVSALLAAIGVTVGVIFAIVQLRDLVRTRQTDLAMRLYQHFGTKEFVNAWWQVSTREEKDYNEYVKKYGLRDLANLNTESKPARSASVLTGHLNTFLASMQANYAGALGIAYINIFYAPYLVDMDCRQMKQVAQELIFSILS